MNKTIFEIAALAFCVSIVLFGSQGFSIIDVVSRSFLVFVGVVVLIIAGLMAVLVIAERVKRTAERNNEPPQAPRKEYTPVGKGPQAVTR